MILSKRLQYQIRYVIELPFSAHTAPSDTSATQDHHVIFLTAIYSHRLGLMKYD